jgi:DNA-binding protein YbaB
MKKLISLVLFGLVVLPAYATDYCEGTGDSVGAVEELAESVNNITGSMEQTQKVLGMTITKFYKNQGGGKVSVVTDAKGNISGIRVDFSVKGQKSQTMIRSFDELKNGEKLEYIEGNEKKPALVVKKANGASIYPSTGGQFTFSVLTEKPNTYQHHNIYLRKVNANWIVKNGSGDVLKSVDLTPNVTDWDWDGTFSDASFE